MTTSFAPVHFPTRHPGVERAVRVADAARRAAQSFDSTRATATLLLAAIASALLVVADQVIETWTEGHLLAAWIVLWTVAFAALALFAAPARSAAAVLRTSYAAWQARRLQQRHDEQFWQAALQDARVMADISRAMSASALHDTRAYY
jgi:hypothetical protein